MLHAAEKNILFMPKTVEKNIGFAYRTRTKQHSHQVQLSDYSFVYNSLSLYNNI